MSTLTLEREDQLALSLDELLGGARGGGANDDRLTGGGLTLDQLIRGVWDGLTAGETAACPICAGRMVPDGRDGEPALGACIDCGAQLG